MKNIFHIPCNSCQSRGKISLPISKKARRRYARRVEKFEQGSSEVSKLEPLKEHIDMCHNCDGTGIISSKKNPEVSEYFPHIAIIGGGIAGVALAVACLHRGIPYTLYERDINFDARSQGYGLTLQQASKAIAGLGIYNLEKSLTSTRHVVHDTTGKIIGEWGRRNLGVEEHENPSKRRNIHISRQSLRHTLLAQIHDKKNIKWGYKLMNISQKPQKKIELNFELGDKGCITETADLVVGADGIRSTVRSIACTDDFHLQYMGCVVILGMCPLEKISVNGHPLLDSQTVFQTVNGYERMYMMPYDTETIMWQFSFMIPESEAKLLSKKGAYALKQETIKRTQNWHSPITEILTATEINDITGYPVYDRKILQTEQLQPFGNITLIGDAMHPMSPFKGQGANQALLDALDLSRDIYVTCSSDSNWKQAGLRETLLTSFEAKMLKRASLKVRDSARAAEWLHSASVMHDGESPRGREI